MNYGYVNPGGQVAIQNEVVHRVKAYFELRQIMERCHSVILYMELRELAKRLREG